MKRVIGSAGLALALTLCSAVVWAQSAEDVEKAQQHFAKGAEFYAAGEYAKAVSQFISGHGLAPNAMFLYNVSLSYGRLGRIGDALAAAEKAIQFEGMPPEVIIRNGARIEGLHLVLRAQKAANAMESVAVKDELPPDRQTETRADGITVMGWAGLGLAAVGTGFVIGGVATNSAVLKEIETYEDAATAGDSASFDDSRDLIEKKQSQGKLFYGIGIGAVGLGAALFIVDLLTGTEEVPVASIIPLSDGAMIQARISF